jgi:hypothetical protein
VFSDLIEKFAKVCSVDVLLYSLYSFNETKTSDIAEFHTIYLLTIPQLLQDLWHEFDSCLFQPDKQKIKPRRIEKFE